MKELCILFILFYYLAFLSLIFTKAKKVCMVAQLLNRVSHNLQLYLISMQKMRWGLMGILALRPSVFYDNDFFFSRIHIAIANVLKTQLNSSVICL